MTFQTNQVLKFATPTSELEAGERYVVVEYRGARPELGDDGPDRVLVRFVCAMPIPPTYVFRADEMTPA